MSCFFFFVCGEKANLLELYRYTLKHYISINISLTVDYCTVTKSMGWDCILSSVPALQWWWCNGPHHGMQHSVPYCFFASCSRRRMRSAWIWNRVLCDGRPTSYMPLGYATPSLVPCPPARSRTATLFWAIHLRPADVTESSGYFSVLVTSLFTLLKNHNNNNEGWPFVELIQAGIGVILSLGLCFFKGILFLLRTLRAEL